jgi:hypothetical protein
MAAEQLSDRIQLTRGERAGLFRIRKADRDALEKHLFLRYPEREWGTFFRFGFRRTSWGLALSFVEPLLPLPGDMDRQTDLATFRDQYIRRAFHHARERTLAIGVIHSHPEGWHTWPSRLDDDMDGYFAREFTAFSGGAPYCSLILQRSERTGLTFSGRVYDRGEWIPVEQILTVGDTLERHESEVTGAEDPLDDPGAPRETTARLESVLGSRSISRLRTATVGIIGCGGTGSPAIHVLARAGVRGLVFVDPQRVGASNLERMHGTELRDVQRDQAPFKVDLMSRLVRSINPSAQVRALVGNLLQENVLDELLRCDVVLGCVDSYHGRAALSDYSRHYLLPVLDLGVVMDGADGVVTNQVGEFTRYSAGDPCAFCLGRIDSTALSFELMTDEELGEREAEARRARERGDDPDQYWLGRPRQLHTVGYLTTAVGALGAGYVEGWLTGTFAMPHPTFQFDLTKNRFGVVAQPVACENGCSCMKGIGWGDAARTYRSVTLPAHWSRRAVLRSAT